MGESQHILIQMTAVSSNMKQSSLQASLLSACCKQPPELPHKAGLMEPG